MSLIDYTLNWTDDSIKPSFVLSDNSVNNTTTSLTLTGNGYGNWLKFTQESLIKRLDNFASFYPPSNPTVGQFWFNTRLNKMLVYSNNNAWVLIDQSEPFPTPFPTPTPTELVPSPTPTPTPTPTPEPIYSYTTITDIPYGVHAHQSVNLYQPIGINKGLIVRVHGGSWLSYDLTIDDPEMIRLAQQGYSVLDTNYRGKNEGGDFPNNVDDIVQVLRNVLISGNGDVWSTDWITIFNLATVGVILSGISAGGHLVTLATLIAMKDYSIAPNNVISMSGPMDLDDTNCFIDPQLMSLVVNPLFLGSAPTTEQLQSASPYFRYGYFNNLNVWVPGDLEYLSSSFNTKFTFIQNQRDTLVTTAMSVPAITNFINHGMMTVSYYAYFQGPLKESFDGTSPVSTLTSTPDGTTLTLPSSGQTLGDAYAMLDGTIWVYNNGTFTGDLVNPASINGFTRWFDHNYTDSEVTMILDTISIESIIF